MYRRQLLSLSALGWAAPQAAPALPAPSGPVVMQVSGRIRHTNQGQVAAFDMAMLAQMPQHRLVTSTPWYSQPRSFTGPLLREVLAAVGHQGKVLRTVALNDYRVEIPIEDTQRWNVVLARLLDDKPMPVRDKGPLFVIYPFDDHAALRNTVYYSRCAWQLKAIEVA